MSFKNKKKQKLKKQGGFERLDLLEEARILLDEKKFREAIFYLEDAAEKYPSEVKFWELLGVAATGLENASTMQRAFTRVRELQPNNAEAWFGLADAYLLKNHFALSIRCLEEYLRRFPDHESKGEGLQILEITRENLRKSVSADFPDDFEQMVDLACLHDESQVLMNLGELEKAREKAVKLIDELPEFLPAYNNLSLILFMDGEAEQAYETAQKGLTKQPENTHALANLVRFALFLGREDEARQLAGQLLSIDTDDAEVWRKKMESAIVIADYQAAVKAFQQSEKAKFGLSVDRSFGTHLAAYAFYRLGKEEEAVRLWEQILVDEPYFAPAIASLYQFSLPERERNIHVLPLTYWIPERYIREFSAEAIKLENGRHHEESLSKKTLRIYEKNPNILGILSFLLEYGDSSGEPFAIEELSRAGTPESLAVLKDFAFSQRGADEQRYRAAAALSMTGLISGKARLWSDGQWRETMVEGFRVTGAAIDSYPIKQKAKLLLEKGFEATRKGKFDLAGNYYKMAHEANQADHPSILYNSLAIKHVRDKKIDVRAELMDIIRKFPDYPFASILLATEDVKTGNIEEAKKLVERFYDKKIFHVTEAKGWFYFHLELALREKHFTAARRALDLLERFDDDLNYEYWDNLIDKAEIAA